MRRYETVIVSVPIIDSEPGGINGEMFSLYFPHKHRNAQLPPRRLDVSLSMANLLDKCAKKSTIFSANGRWRTIRRCLEM